MIAKAGFSKVKFSKSNCSRIAPPKTSAMIPKGITGPFLSLIRFVLLSGGGAPTYFFKSRALFRVDRTGSAEDPSRRGTPMLP